MNLIIYNDKFGDIVRIGLYNEKGKWIKWIPKKKLDTIIEDVDTVENKLI